MGGIKPTEDNSASSDRRKHSSKEAAPGAENDNQAHNKPDMPTQYNSLRHGRALEALDFEKPIRSTLIKLALPLVMANILTTLIGYVDFYMIQELGKEAHAGFAMSRTGIFVVNSVFMGVSVGASAFVSRTLGAGETQKSRQYAAQAIMVCIYLSFPIMLLGFALGPYLFTLLGAEGASAGYGWDYISIIYLGISVFGMRFVTNGVFNALGQTRFPMYLNIIFNLANFLGNLILIPRFGVMGSAMSTIATCGIVMAAAIYILYHNRWASFALAHFRGAEKTIRNMLRLGSPMMLQAISRQGAMIGLFRIISMTPNATAGAATLGLGIIVESISFMLGIAVMISAGALVGQALGAKRKDKALETYREAVMFTLVIMSILGTVLFIFATPFVDFFSNDAGVITEGTLYLRIHAFAQPLMAITFAGIGCLRGAGDTKYPLFLTLIALYAVRLPAAYILAVTFGMGLSGVWCGMVISNLVEAILIVHRIKQRKWIDIKLSY